jgi:oligoribonuclease
MNKLIWVDLEMTGLNVNSEVIIEIATVITDTQLNIIAHGPNLVIQQPEDILNNMDEWNTSHHNKSGLTTAVKDSKISLYEAEQLTLSFLQNHVAENTSPICGNSIYQDRIFLAKYMPQLEKFFHYRALDVSTIKILIQNWYPEYTFSSKDSSHRALDDILTSINECKHYKKLFDQCLNNSA